MMPLRRRSRAGGGERYPGERGCVSDVTSECEEHAARYAVAGRHRGFAMGRYSDGRGEPQPAGVGALDGINTLPNPEAVAQGQSGARSSQDRCPGATVSRCTPWRRWKPHPPQRDRSGARELVRDRDGHPRREQHPLPNPGAFAQGQSGAHSFTGQIPRCSRHALQRRASTHGAGALDGSNIRYPTQSSCSESERSAQLHRTDAPVLPSAAARLGAKQPHPPQRDRSSARELVPQSVDGTDAECP